MQEAVSSAESLIILIRTAPLVQFQHLAHSLFTQNPNMIHGIFAIIIKDVLELFKVSRKFLMSMAQHPSMSGELYHGTTISFNARDMPWFQGAAYILDKVDNLYPVVEATNNPLAFFHAISVGNFSPRKICNAAVALYFLRISI